MFLQLPSIEETPLVSILISSYNHAGYIEEAVISALKQSYSNVEVIVCDDGSKDNSAEILDSLQQAHPKKLSVLKKKNGGQASAVNSAFQQCKGDIICFLDSDDYFYQEKAQHIVDYFKKNTAIGFLVHRLDKVNGEGKKFGQLPISSSLPLGYYAKFVINTGSTPSGFPVTSGLILRREIASQLFPFNEQIFYDLDEIIRRLALLTTKVGHIDKSLGAYRIHGKNITAMDIQSRLKIMMPIYSVMWEETKQFVKKFHPDDVEKFPNLDEDLHHLLMNYVLKRLNHETGDAKKYLKRVKENKTFKSLSAARKGFWMLAINSPDFIFERMITFYWGPNGLKLILSKIQFQFRYLFKNNT